VGDRRAESPVHLGDRLRRPGDAGRGQGTQRFGQFGDTRPPCAERDRGVRLRPRGKHLRDTRRMRGPAISTIVTAPANP
jgi:hypothetical protein